MEYSSSKKERLPGISFDTNFDNSSCSSSSATDDGSISQRQISTPKHLKMLGPRANENINNQSTTPYNRKRRSLSQQPRRSSRNHHSLGDSSTANNNKQRKRSRSLILSPTTLKLHETANCTVNNHFEPLLSLLSI